MSRSTSFSSVIGRLAKPLASRKVRVALATVIAAYAAEYGLGVSEEMVFTILGVGAAVILGIAHEDNGVRQAPAAAPPVAQFTTVDRDLEAAVEQLRREE